MFLSPSPSPFNSLVLITHQSGQLENKQLRNQRAVMFPRAENLSQSLPLPFQRPGCLPSLQQPAGTLLLRYSWPACSCSYSPRLTQQQLLYVCQLASRSPKSSCPPRSFCFPSSHLQTCFSVPTLVSHLPHSAPVSYLPTVLILPLCCSDSPYLLSGKHLLFSLSSLLSSNRSSLKWSSEYCF